MKTKSLLIAFLVVVLSSFLFTSCEKDGYMGTGGGEGEIPPIDKKTSGELSTDSIASFDLAKD